MTTLEVVLSVLLLAAVALLGWVWFTSRSKQQRAAGAMAVLSNEVQQQDTRIKEAVLTTKTRFLIRVKDWGPDFDAPASELPRYRWTVGDADRHLKQALDMQVSEQDFFMLGNEPTRDGAWFAALVWVEDQQNPVVVIDGDEL